MQDLGVRKIALDFENNQNESKTPPAFSLFSSMPVRTKGRSTSVASPVFLHRSTTSECPCPPARHPRPWQHPACIAAWFAETQADTEMLGGKLCERKSSHDTRLIREVTMLILGLYQASRLNHSSLENQFLLAPGSCLHTCTETRSANPSHPCKETKLV